VGNRDVTAIVVNYNSGSDLETCLDSLLADTESLARVLVVDNNSTDLSWQIAETYTTHDPRVALVRLSENLGLAGGVNEVLADADTAYIAVLNPDVAPSPGWLGPLTALLEDDLSIGAACPLVLMADGRHINSAGQHVHVTGLGFNRLLGAGAEAAGDDRVEVDGLHGAAFVIRTELLRDLGGWDTTGFLYQEDVALSWDILLSGKRIVFVPDSRVRHDYHLTMYPEKLYLLERNRWALLLSHLRRSRLLLLSPALLISELLVWGLTFVRGRRFIAAKWQSWIWVWSNRNAISEWRERVFARPTHDSANLRRHTHWSYPISQLSGLGAERGESIRVPPGGLSV
jgi:GT2 family glycosyltransferase